MRSLRPNRRGMLVPTVVKPTTSSSATLSKPSNSLINLDRVIKGSEPAISVVRSKGGIGDVLMTLPTVRAISKKYNCQVDYATDFNYLDGALVKVLQGNPYIREIIPWRELDKEKYNAVVNLTCPCTAHEKPGAKPINRIDLFARHAQIDLAGETSIDYNITPEEKQWAEQYLFEHNLDRYNLILVQPSSSATHRDAPVEKMQRSLANILQLKKNSRAIVITHDTDNKKSDWHFSDVHILNNFDVRQIAAIMSLCDIVICPDSAILHLASALHKKTVTLFGPTDPRARINYHPEAVSIWPAKNLRSYPYWYETPPDGYLCWKLIEESLITKVALALLDDSPLPISGDLVTFDKKQPNQQYEIL